ncbi:cytochrome [Mycobacterium sp. 852002-50816_SCH5313054-b]|uniref:cytochrome P450 n=1 Tax=Mycobacterium sp. 852002-50816_SCH5313054-b TaxID=1834092 RepID=UPI0007FC0CBE|nr:cytochrome P450 [Mycobacterium sp. 852002-50816_SCH5313054-b]OBF62257.1 cytochrome [Mycobacterium sp. 852002-50816_SCH5313054-b]
MTIAVDASICPSVFGAGLPTVDYEHCQSPDEAHDIISAARLRAPIAIGPHGPELLTYELVRTVLRDPRFRVPQGMFLASQGITSGPLWERVATNLISLDGPEHHRLRRLVSKAFTPRATARLRTTIVEVITELVDRHTATGRCEVVTDIARRFPVPIICALLGAPAEDWELFSNWTDDIFKAFSWDVAAHQRAILAAWDELDDYIDDMMAQRRHRLTDDLISELIRAEDDGDRLSAGDLRMLAAGLLMAGTDTTRNQLAASVHVLCDHPDQWALLARHPELANNAVEETMRHSPIAVGTLRTAREDVEIAGVMIPAGTLVVANTGAANRDPAVYDDPDRLDITRQDAPPMQTFGAGMHYCLGANLARLELAEALAVMTQRMPNAHRTGPAPWKPLTGIAGPITLPIAFDPCPGEPAAVMASPQPALDAPEILAW